MDGFGQRLKQFATAKFGSQKGLADALGISAPRITNYVQEINQPDPDILAQLAAFDCNINWLLTGEGEMYFRPDANEKKLKQIQEAVQSIINA